MDFLCQQAKTLGVPGGWPNRSASCRDFAGCTPRLMEMSDLVSLSKHLPLTVTNLSHAVSSPHLLFSVLLPSYPVNPLEQRLSSRCPHVTQHSRVSKYCWKTSFFLFFFFLNKPTRSLTENTQQQQGTDFILGSTSCPRVLDAHG